MNDMTIQHGLGHNSPPATMADTLAEKYQDTLTQAAEVLDSASRAPSRINDDDDETAGKFAELIKKSKAIEDTLETAFNAEKAPHQQTITQISGFFKKHLETLEAKRKALNVIAKDYSDRKKAAKQKKLEEEAAAKRAEEDRKRREANEARQTKEASQAALQEFQRLSRDADEARASATSELEQAQAQVAIAEAKLAKVRSDNSTIAADYAQRVVDGNPVSDEERNEAKTRAALNLQNAKDDLEAARQLLAEARERAKQAREAARKAEELEAEKKREADKAAREEKAATKEADQHATVAEKLETKAETGTGLGNTRSIHGALAGQQTRWECTITDRNALDKAALWGFIDEDVLRVAASKWMNLQPEDKRQMPGTIMREVSFGTVR